MKNGRCVQQLLSLSFLFSPYDKQGLRPTLRNSAFLDCCRLDRIDVETGLTTNQAKIIPQSPFWDRPMF